MKKILQIGLFLLTLTYTSFSAGFKMSPYYFDKQIDKDGGAQEYTLFNDSSEKIRYKINVTGSSQEMNKWIEIYPKVVTIAPKSEGKFKLFIKAPEGTKPGEYNFTIAPQPISIPVLRKTEAKKGEVNIQATAKIGLSLPLAGFVGERGDIKKDIKFDNFKISGNNLSFQIINHLNGNFRGIAQFLGQNKNTLQVISIDKLEPEKSRDINVSTKEPIRYVRIYNGTDETYFFEKKL